jgi:hypothetical protein
MSLGIMLGALLHIMYFPETIAKFSFTAEGDETRGANTRSAKRKPE